MPIHSIHKLAHCSHSHCHSSKYISAFKVYHPTADNCLPSTYPSDNHHHSLHISVSAFLSIVEKQIRELDGKEWVRVENTNKLWKFFNDVFLTKVPYLTPEFIIFFTSKMLKCYELISSLNSIRHVWQYCRVGKCLLQVFKLKLSDIVRQLYVFCSEQPKISRMKRSNSLSQNVNWLIWKVMRLFKGKMFV